VKIDSLGNIQWQNTIGGDNDDRLFSLQETSDMGYILGGISNSNISGDKSENDVGGSDFWIVKVDSLGNLQWENTIGGSSGEDLVSIQVTSDGGFIIGGISYSDISGDKTENHIGASDYWIVKIDIYGNVKWQNSIGGFDSEYLRNIQQTIDGGYIIGGISCSGISCDKSEAGLGYWDNNYWIVKTDSIGIVEWDNTIAGSLNEMPCTIEQAMDGGFYLGGTSNSNMSSDKTENCNGFNDFWIIKLTEKYNGISGRIFADLNNNAIQDVTEPSLVNRLVVEQNSGRIAFSDQNGKYSLAVLDSGSFLTYPTPLNLYSSSPATHATYFSGIHQLDSLNDFAFQPQGAFDEVAVTITPLSGFRSGFNAGYMINYSNAGTTTVIPTIVFNPDNNISYQSASVTPNQITTDSVVWVLPSISPFQTGSIIVYVKVDLGLAIGSPLTSSVHIDPYNSDVNQSNNNANWEVFTSGSLDPNDILVSDDTLTTSQLNSSPWLDYIVRFQNTGNDTAFTVKILNPIDTNKLNISSIEFVNASHPVNLNWIIYQRNMEFKFDNILLPDSNVNEPLSHGFVHYRIKPKSNLVVGDTIKNFAAIYFDFNEPVITNTAQTVIVSPTGLSSLSSSVKLLVYPNPANSKVNINGIKLENGKAQLRLFDIYGILILEKIITFENPDLDIQNLPSGMYLLQSGNQRATFVKQ
jgi:Secretion system C-terminal sorting domain